MFQCTFRKAVQCQNQNRLSTPPIMYKCSLALPSQINFMRVVLCSSIVKSLKFFWFFHSSDRVAVHQNDFANICVFSIFVLNIYSRKTIWELTNPKEALVSARTISLLILSFIKIGLILILADSRFKNVTDYKTIK